MYISWKGLLGEDFWYLFNFFFDIIIPLQHFSLPFTPSHISLPSLLQIHDLFFSPIVIACINTFVLLHIYTCICIYISLKITYSVLKCYLCVCFQGWWFGIGQLIGMLFLRRAISDSYLSSLACSSLCRFEALWTFLCLAGISIVFSVFSFVDVFTGARGHSSAFCLAMVLCSGLRLLQRDVSLMRVKVTLAVVWGQMFIDCC